MARTYRWSSVRTPRSAGDDEYVYSAHDLQALRSSRDVWNRLDGPASGRVQFSSAGSRARLTRKKHAAIHKHADRYRNAWWT